MKILSDKAFQRKLDWARQQGCDAGVTRGYTLGYTAGVVASQNRPTTPMPKWKQEVEEIIKAREGYNGR